MNVIDYFDEGLLFRKQGNLELAIEKFYSAIKMNPNFVPALNQLAGIHESNSNFSASISYRERIAQLQPKNALANANLARAMMKQGNIVESIDFYKNALELQPMLPVWVYNDLGNALRQNGQISEAIDTYQISSQTYPYNIATYLELAKLKKKQGDIDTAIMFYLKAIAFCPKLPPGIYIKLGDAFNMQQKVSEADVAYQKAIQIAPKGSDLIYINIAESWLKHKQYELAINVIQKAISLYPDSYELYYYLAKALIKNKNIEEAIDICHQVLEIYPTITDFQKVPKKEVYENSAAIKLEQLILKIATKAIEKNCFFKITELIALLKDSIDIKIYSISSIADSVINNPKIDFCKKCVLLQLLSSLSHSEKLLNSWVESFCNYSSAQEDITVLAILNPYKRDVNYRLSFEQRVNAIKPLKNSIDKKLLLVLEALYNNCLDDSSHIKSGVKKFLFVFSFLPSFPKTSSHLKTTIDYAHFLTKFITDSVVYVLITNELSLNDDVLSKPQNPTLKEVSFYHTILQSYYPEALKENIKFIVIPPNKVCQSDYSIHLLKTVVDINPDVILFFGGVFSSWILPEVLYHKYPTIYMQFNIKNKPLSNYDIYICHGNKDNFNGLINADRWRKHQRLFMPFPKQKKYSYTRVKPLRDFVTIITVGGTLEQRIVQNSYLDKMGDLLSYYTKVSWLLVGVRDVNTFLERSKNLKIQYQQNKVHFIDFEPDLRSLYEHCDIYAYPRHSGGGGGTFLAAIEGLPIVCYKGNDIESSFLRTPIKFFESDDDYFQYLEQLIIDPLQREADGEKLKNFLSNSYPYSCIEDFLNLCDEALNKFNIRSSQVEKLL